MTKTLLLATAFVLLAPSAFATQDNSAAVSGQNNEVNQLTGNGNTLLTGSGAIGSATTNTATGGTGGNATANGGAGGSVIASGNSSSVANGGQGGRGGDGGTGVGIGGSQSQSATTGNQNATTGNQSVSISNKRSAATAFAAPLVTGYECNGSTSAGVQAPGIGLSFGGTHPSAVCETVFLAREVERKGHRIASLGILCENETVRRNMRFEADQHCPQDAADVAALGTTASEPPVRNQAPGNGSRNR